MLKVYQASLPLVTQDEKILSKPTVRRAQPKLVSGSTESGKAPSPASVAIEVMHGVLRDHKITKMINWQLPTIFFFKSKTYAITLPTEIINHHFYK